MPLLSLLAVIKANCFLASSRRTCVKVLAVVVISSATMMLAASAARPDEVPSQTQRNVAGIVEHRGGRSILVGTAFFVAVPSQVVPGRAFIYLVTAHHNLLDPARHALIGLSLTVEDAKTGAMREEPLPAESRWVLDPRDENADVAAVPFNPQNANIAPIPLSSLLGGEGDPLARPETGAQVYYLTAATVGMTRPRFEALARFGHVSVPVPAETGVPGAAAQNLCFLDGGGTPGFSSGAPVFVSAGLRFLLWGILEANSAASRDPVFAGLAGVLPANCVADTVNAMAQIQEKALRAQTAR
jgi:hypothetical protein